MAVQSNGDVTIEGKVGIVHTLDGELQTGGGGKIGGAELLILEPGAPWRITSSTGNKRLMPLPELETKIRKDRHLPGIPSAEEVKVDGINVGSMQALLLKKVEELTLYVIDQDKRLKSLRRETSSYVVGRNSMGIDETGTGMRASARMGRNRRAFFGRRCQPERSPHKPVFHVSRLRTEVGTHSPQTPT